MKIYERRLSTSCLLVRQCQYRTNYYEVSDDVIFAPHVALGKIVRGLIGSWKQHVMFYC